MKILRKKEQKEILMRIAANHIIAKNAIDRLHNTTEMSFVFYDGSGVVICENLLKQMGYTPRRSFDGAFYTVTVENHK